MAVKRSSVDDELARVRAAAADPRTASAAEDITRGLSSKHARVVTSAAQLVKSRRLEGFTKALQAAYGRLLEDAVKRDPGCQAKLAVLEALDFTESMDEEPFVAATSLVQLEPAWGKPVDSAGPCRGRAILALARIGHTDTVLLASPLLADPEVSARVAAADALAASGVRHAAGALLLKLAYGDEDPLVLIGCMSGVLSLAPEVALARFAPVLLGRNEEQRELVAVCFGQSTRPDACQALITALEACVLSKERAVLYRALGLHRSDTALDVLLGVIDSGSEVDAKAAIRALGPRRFDPGLRDRVERAVSGRAELEREYAEAFKAE